MRSPRGVPKLGYTVAPMEQRAELSGWPGAVVVIDDRAAHGDEDSEAACHQLCSPRPGLLSTAAWWRCVGRRGQGPNALAVIGGVDLWWWSAGPG